MQKGRAWGHRVAARARRCRARAPLQIEGGRHALPLLRLHAAVHACSRLSTRRCSLHALLLRLQNLATAWGPCLGCFWGLSAGPQTGQGVADDLPSVLPLVAVLAQPRLQLFYPALAVLVQRQAVAQQILQSQRPKALALCCAAGRVRDQYVCHRKSEYSYLQRGGIHCHILQPPDLCAQRCSLLRHVSAALSEGCGCKVKKEFMSKKWHRCHKEILL